LLRFTCAGKAGEKRTTINVRKLIFIKGSMIGSKIEFALKQVHSFQIDSILFLSPKK